MTQIIFPEWRDMQGDSKYPFVDTADLTNGTITFPKSMFIDARLVAIGGGPRQYISEVIVSTTAAVVHISDENGELSTGEVVFGSGQTTIELLDTYGRPAGMLVAADSDQLNVLASWPVDTHAFTLAQTEFTATVVVPTPQIGVRGFLAEGKLFAADVYLLGEQGVFITRDGAYIRIDIIGDPRARQRFCSQLFSYDPPWFIQSINGYSPDDYGEWKIVSGVSLASDTVLRVEAIESGIGLRLVGPVKANAPD